MILRYRLLTARTSTAAARSSPWKRASPKPVMLNSTSTSTRLRESQGPSVRIRFLLFRQCLPTLRCRRFGGRSLVAGIFLGGCALSIRRGGFRRTTGFCVGLIRLIAGARLAGALKLRCRIHALHDSLVTEEAAGRGLAAE